MAHNTQSKLTTGSNQNDDTDQLTHKIALQTPSLHTTTLQDHPSTGHLFHTITHYHITHFTRSHQPATGIFLHSGKKLRQPFECLSNEDQLLLKSHLEMRENYREMSPQPSCSTDCSDFPSPAQPDLHAGIGPLAVANHTNT